MSAAPVAAFRSAAALALAGLVVAAAAHAHHSVLPFDNERGTTLGGVVARVLWQNPHVLLSLDVVAPNGAPSAWTVESESPGVLETLGWARDSVAAGTRVTVLGAAAKDGSRTLRCKEIALADGRTLQCFARYP